MLGLAWTEASRSEDVAKRLETSGRRPRRRKQRVATHGSGLSHGGSVSSSAKSAIIPVPVALPRRIINRTYVDKNFCFAMATSERRLVMVNWSNHPVLDLRVGNALEEEEARVHTTTHDTKNYRPVCLVANYATVQEASDTLQHFLFSDEVMKKSVILIGHHLERILKQWNVPSNSISYKRQRCTATYPPYMVQQEQLSSDATLSKVLLVPAKLEDLMQRILKRHPSNNLWHKAAAALDLYKKAQPYWEEDLDKMIQQKEGTNLPTTKLQ